MNAQRIVLALLATAAIVVVAVLVTVQRDHLRVGYMNITAHVPVVAALDLAMFDAEGLDVDERVYPDTPTLMAALKDGLIDVAYQVTPDFAWSQDANGFQAYLVAASDTLRPIDGLLARSGFLLSDTGAIRVGHFPGPTAEAMTHTIVAAILDGDTSRVAFTAVPPPLQLQYLEQARVDLLFTYEPLVTLATARVGATLAESAPVERYVLAGAPWYGGVGILSEELVSLRPQAAAAYIRAIRRAVDTLEVDAQLRAALLARLQPGLGLDLAGTIPITRTLLADSRAERDSIDAGLARQLDLYRGLGIVPQSDSRNLRVYQVRQ